MADTEPKATSKQGPNGPRIDRDLFEPPYYQLVNILRHQIATGDLRPGDRILSEAQLCEQYEVSPMTARRALTILLDEGLVTATRGRGTFVKPLELTTATFGLQALEGLFSDERTSVRFLSVKTVPATQRISRKLGVLSTARSSLFAACCYATASRWPTTANTWSLTRRGRSSRRRWASPACRACSRGRVRRCSSAAICGSRRRCSPTRRRGYWTKRPAAPPFASSTPSLTLRSSR